MHFYKKQLKVFIFRIFRCLFLLFRYVLDISFIRKICYLLLCLLNILFILYYNKDYAYRLRDYCNEKNIDFGFVFFRYVYYEVNYKISFNKGYFILKKLTLFFNKVCRVVIRYLYIYRKFVQNIPKKFIVYFNRYSLKLRRYLSNFVRKCFPWFNFISPYINSYKVAPRLFCEARLLAAEHICYYFYLYSLNSFKYSIMNYYFLIFLCFAYEYKTFFYVVSKDMQQYMENFIVLFFNKINLSNYNVLLYYLSHTLLINKNEVPKIFDKFGKSGIRVLSSMHSAGVI